TLAGGAATSLSLTSGWINVDSAKTATISTVLAGSAGFHKVGAGTLVLTVDSTMTGTRFITGGVVSIDNQTRLGSAVSTINLDGGTLRQTNPGNGGSFVNANIALNITPNGGTVDFATPSAASIYQ